MQASPQALAVAFGLTLFAGLSTGIGSALALLTRRTSRKFLSVALGFSAGVMVYVSFAEILPQAQASLSAAMGGSAGEWTAVAGFFLGVLVSALADRLLPAHSNPHEAHTIEEMDGREDRHRHSLMRTGVFTAIALAIHNFSEGLATLMAALSDPRLGVAVAIAIAIHNIPEGIAVSIPVYHATGSRGKAFRLSFLSGLSEPVGAAVGYLLLYPFINDFSFGIVMAAVAGIMVYVSLDELLPTSREYGEHHLAIGGLFAGMAVMAVSLLLIG
ncbi:MAG TPA: zinc transporter ZupT [Candidatus Limnocylindria bacterium]|nr:zinc transporter ZupT [Candidatus Limnocylindria bacterium]